MMKHVCGVLQPPHNVVRTFMITTVDCRLLVAKHVGCLIHNVKLGKQEIVHLLHCAN